MNRSIPEVESGAIASGDANDVIQGLARILVPINFTREVRFRHDPALTVPPLPTISVAGDLDHYTNGTEGSALTQLTRGQNRLVSAIRQAKRQVEQVVQ